MVWIVTWATWKYRELGYGWRVLNLLEVQLLKRMYTQSQMDLSSQGLIPVIFQIVVGIWRKGQICLPVTMRCIHPVYPFFIHRCQAEKWLHPTVCSAFIHLLNNHRQKNSTSCWHFHGYLMHLCKYSMTGSYWFLLTQRMWFICLWELFFLNISISRYRAIFP